MSNVVRISNFPKDVLERSFVVPVLVDFWAEWCGPCKVLGPILERLAGESGGRWILGTLNTEEYPEDSARYDIRSIPAVKLFIDGVVADEFTGALPEYAVRQWLGKAIPGPSAATLTAAGDLIAGGDMSGAVTLLRPVVSEEPENAGARVLLARALVLTDPAEALALIRGLEEPLMADEIDMVVTIARLHGLREHPDELPAAEVRERYIGAIGKYFGGDVDGALSAFIGIIRDDRGYDEDGSRKACIAIFRMLGEDHEITGRHRRDFGSALYI